MPGAWQAAHGRVTVSGARRSARVMEPATQAHPRALRGVR